jgi:hypothetical protein
MRLNIISVQNNPEKYLTFTSVSKGIANSLINSSLRPSSGHQTLEIRLWNSPSEYPLDIDIFINQQNLSSLTTHNKLSGKDFHQIKSYLHSKISNILDINKSLKDFNTYHALRVNRTMTGINILGLIKPSNTLTPISTK